VRAWKENVKWEIENEERTDPMQRKSIQQEQNVRGQVANGS